MFLDNPIEYLFRDFVKIRIEQLNNHDNQALIVQKSMLLWNIMRAQKTQFGRKHHFSKIHSIREFQKNVPISHYVEFKKDIKKMMNGEKNILWPGEIHYFTKSSATTAESKYIPVSRSTLLKCHFKGGKDMLALYMRANPNTKIFSGKALSLCGILHSYPKNPEIEVGDISAIITKNLPLSAQFFRFPGPELALRNGWESKIEEISTLAIKQNITAIVGVPMWTMVFLKKILEKSGKKNIFEVWPNLEVFMHGGISFKPYRSIFDEMFGEGKMKYIESYNASEGYFAIQDDLSKPNEMRLMLDYGIFYEFIPLKFYQKGDYTAYTIAKVEIGINYVIIISTNSGLWRYVIGDTVMFTSLSPYRIKITGRTKQYLNLYDEEITMDNVEHAIAYACGKTNSQVENFTMCGTLPDKDGRGRHEWVIEFNKKPKNLKDFIKKIDEALIKENGDYASRRENNIVLDKPIIHSVPEGSFYNWMKSKDRLGGQFKVQRVSNSREYVDGILNFIKVQ
jgi:hypothetical protein